MVLPRHIADSKTSGNFLLVDNKEVAGAVEQRVLVISSRGKLRIKG